jgi:hypothetical protein
MAHSPIAAETIDLCQRRGVEIVVEGSPGYPRLLSQIDDPPGVLFVRGTLEACDALAVSIVGARHATAYGRRVAHQLAGALTRAGYTVVSGLARGIDHAAHRGALDAGGRTLAVLGSGVLEIYPPERPASATLSFLSPKGAVLTTAPTVTLDTLQRTITAVDADDPSLLTVSGSTGSLVDGRRYWWVSAAGGGAVDMVRLSELTDANTPAFDDPPPSGFAASDTLRGARLTASIPSSVTGTRDLNYRIH